MEYIRRSLGLTQKQFAKKIGISQPQESKWENGDGLENISVKKIIKISELTGLCPVAIMCMLVNYLKHCNAMGGEIKFNECYLMKKYHKDFMNSIKEA